MYSRIFFLKQKKFRCFYFHFSCILGLAPVFLSLEFFGEFFGDGGQDHEEPESSTKKILNLKKKIAKKTPRYLHQSHRKRSSDTISQLSISGHLHSIKHVQKALD